jgi:branched-chain amino acid transport system permease protein
MTALSSRMFDIGGVKIEAFNFIIFGSALLLVGGFYVFFQRSRLGLHMRAVAENLQAASAMGISPDRVYAFAWGISLAMAGVAGVFFGHYTAAIDLNIAAIGIRAAPAAIVGTLEQVGSGYLGADYRDVIPFLILTIMLYVRPAGLYGSKELIRI